MSPRIPLGEALLRERIETMFAGDIDTGKAILRDYIKATIGFEKLGEATDTPPADNKGSSSRSFARIVRPSLLG